MRQAPLGLQELRRRIYRKAKSDTAHRFWGLFVPIPQAETLAEASRIAKRNGGAAGIDGQTVADLEASGLARFLAEVRAALLTGRDNPQPNRRVEIPQENGKVRVLHMPCIRDRVVQGALQRILAALCEADFCPNSSGFRPKRSPHRALAAVRRSVLRRMSTGIAVDLSRYFDTIRHSMLLDKRAKRVQDPAVMPLIKQIIPVGGPIGVPQGGPFSPLAAHLSLNEVDWTCDAIRRQTAEGPDEAVNYHRCADESVLTVSGHHRKRGWAQRALQRLEEQLLPLGVEVHPEQTKLVNTLQGAACGVLGFDRRRVRQRKGEGYYLLMPPKKKARKALKATRRDIIRGGGAAPATTIVSRMNAALAGWVNSFRVGNASRACSEVRDYTERKVRTLLTRRKRRRKSSVGWRRGRNAYLYEVLGLYWDWTIHPLPSAERSE